VDIGRECGGRTSRGLNRRSVAVALGWRAAAADLPGEASGSAGKLQAGCRPGGGRNVAGGVGGVSVRTRHASTGGSGMNDMVPRGPGHRWAEASVREKPGQCGRWGGARNAVTALSRWRVTDAFGGLWVCVGGGRRGRVRGRRLGRAFRFSGGRGMAQMVDRRADGVGGVEVRQDQPFAADIGDAWYPAGAAYRV